MKRTHQNLEDMRKKGELVLVLVTLEAKSNEIMASVGEHQTSGSGVDRMTGVLERIGFKENLDRSGMHVHSVWTLMSQEVWDQSSGPKAGNRIGQVLHARS